METVINIGRDLRAHGRVVASFAAVAILVAAALTWRPAWPPQSRSYAVGTATANALVDTPVSQVVGVSPKGSGDLAARASLLSNLLVQRELRNAVAARAGVAPKDLLAVDDSIAAEASGHDPTTVSAARLSRRHAIVLRTTVLKNDTGLQLPVIVVQTQADSAARAAALADGAVAVLQDYLDSRAAAEQVPTRDRLRVRALGPAQAYLEPRGPSRALSVLAGAMVFALLCGLLLLAQAFTQRWREMESAEALADVAAGGPTSQSGPLRLAGDEDRSSRDEDRSSREDAAAGRTSGAELSATRR